jgi:hypothetical protein
MKRLVFVLLVSLAVSVSLSAQQPSFLNFDLNSNHVSQPSFLTASAPNTALVPPLALPPNTAPLSPPIPSAALPDAPPPPPPVSGSLLTRWDLAAGYEYVHFSSAPFSANLSGLHTSLAYSLTDWFAVEGSFVGAFGGDVFSSGDTTKYVLITGGGRIYWSRDPKRFSPWAHALVGVLHMNPQIADSSKNGFALQVGGGVDYFFNPRLSFRGEADYVYSRLYSGNQNNIQIGVGFVVHF